MQSIGIVALVLILLFVERDRRREDRLPAAERHRDRVRAGSLRPARGRHPRVRLPGLRARAAQSDADADPHRRLQRDIDALVRDRLGAGSALYALDEAMLERLRPDLIVTQALCDVCAVAEDEVRGRHAACPADPAC